VQIVGLIWNYVVILSSPKKIVEIVKNGDSLSAVTRYIKKNYIKVFTKKRKLQWRWNSIQRLMQELNDVICAAGMIY